MHRLVTAAIATALPTEEAPKEIVYIPEGDHDIRPYVDGKAGDVRVSLRAEKGPLVAAAFQRDLERRLGENVRPWVDFEHKSGASAGNPTAFRYEPGRGLIMSMDWSQGGRAAIEGKDFSYFSPSFLVEEDGTPSGLDARGPLGALVNEPAFRDIPRIAAADATGRDQTEATPTMSKLIFAALAISAAAENAETEAVKAIDKLKVDAADSKKKVAELEEKIDAMTKERDALKKDMEKVEATAAEERKERTKTLVAAAIADGRIAPKDEETAKDFREKLEAGDNFAEKILAKLPKKEGPGKPVIEAAARVPGKKDDDDNPYARVEAAFAEEVKADS